MLAPMRSRPALLTVLAALLLLQWGTAFGHCLRLAGTGEPVLHAEICTPEGLRVVALPGDEEDHGPGHGGLVCPVCAALGGAILPTPSAGVPTPALVHAVAFEAPAAGHLLPPPPHRPGNPRGPPSL